jgi:hypothetical protein
MVCITDLPTPSDTPQFTDSNVFATYFGPGSGDGIPPPTAGIGACQIDLPTNAMDKFVALGADVYDPSKCGSCVQINYTDTTTIGVFADLCEACGSGVDLSVTLFNDLTGSWDLTYQLGKIPVSWSFVDCPVFIADPVPTNTCACT